VIAATAIGYNVCTRRILS